MDDLIGQQLGQYQIVELLGVGGMAKVYRAHQTSIRRDVAIKVIEPRLAHEADFLRRFEREAQTVASLSHPHILKVFDYGQQDDRVYLVMELLTGGSLAHLINVSSGLEFGDAARMLDQIAAALDYAHELGIVHRDLKPQNVLLDKRGNAFLTDFGIAKLLHETTSLTQTGAAIGTPAYMSPEQWQGVGLDGRSDVYSLGVMLFEMLSGLIPFAADTPYNMMHKHIYEEPPPVARFRLDVPDTVQPVIDKMLAKDREQRWASAGEAANAFRAATAGQGAAPAVVTPGAALPPASREAVAPTRQPVETPAPPNRDSGVVEILPPAVRPSPSRLPILVGALVGLVVVAVLAGVGLSLLANRPTPPAAVPTAAGVLGTPPAGATTSVPATSVPTGATPTSVPPTLAPTATPQIALTDAANRTATMIMGIFFTQTAIAGAMTALVPTKTPILPTATPLPPTPTVVPPTTPAPTTAVPPITATAPIVIITATAPPVANGQILFTSYRDGVGQIYVMNTDGSHQTRLTNDGAEDLRAVWSPDNKNIAFESKLWDGRYEIGVMNADGNDVQQLTSTPKGDNLNPVWSPDGTQIAFTSTRDNNAQIYVMNADGSDPQRVSDNGANERYPAWSPDGSLIAFTSTRDGNDEIYVMHPDGTGVKRLTSNPATDYMPAWSPDGEFVAFVSNRTGGYQIYLMNADGTNPRRLTKDGDNFDPSFSPDGQAICFYSTRDGQNHEAIYVMDSTGYNQRRLTSTDSRNWIPSWSH